MFVARCLPYAKLARQLAIKPLARAPTVFEVDGFGRKGFKSTYGTDVVKSFENPTRNVEVSFVWMSRLLE